MMRKSNTSPAMPMPAWPSGVTHAPRCRAGLEAQHREVAGAAAEVADQHGGRLGQRLGEPPAGGLGFQRQCHVREARPRHRRRAGGRHQARSSANSPAKRTGRPTMTRGTRPGVGQQRLQEPADQALERERAAEDARLGEAPLREVCLHRHDQAAVQRVLEIGRRSPPVLPPRAAGCGRGPPRPRSTAPSGTRRAVRASPAWRARRHAAVLVQQRDDAVGGAEIDADRPHHAAAPPKGAGSSAIGDAAQGSGGRLAEVTQHTALLQEQGDAVAECAAFLAHQPWVVRAAAMRLTAGLAARAGAAAAVQPAPSVRHGRSRRACQPMGVSAMSHCLIHRGSRGSVEPQMHADTRR